MHRRHVAALATAFMLAACAAPSPPSPDEASIDRIAIGEQVRLPYHHRVAIRGTSYIIRFQDVVEDSRCPPDVQCVWAGRVRIDLAFEGGAEPARDTLASSGPAESTTARYGSIVVRFVGYEPPPAPSGQRRTPDNAVAILAIEQAAGS